MVAFGALLGTNRVSQWRDHYIAYDELKALLAQEDLTALAFEAALDREIERAALFATAQMGRVAGALEQARDDTETGRQAAASLLACIQYVELNLVAVRKIVKKRDTVATRRQLGGGRGGAWLLSAARSPHLTALESFDAPFAALLATARRAADRAARSRPSSPTSALGPLLANGDAANARALAALVKACDAALAQARAARADLRESVAANFGIDAEDAYAEAICVVPEALPPSSEASDDDDDGARALWCVIGYAGLLAASTAAAAPGAYEYAVALELPPAAAGVLLGAAPLAALAFRPAFEMEGGARAKPRLVACALAAALGNLVYGFAPAAPPFPGLVAALLARGALGAAAAADAAHRQYLKAVAPPGRRVRSAARYVAAESLGGVVGVGLAVVMKGARVSTAAPRVLAVALLLFAAFVAAYWREAPRERADEARPRAKDDDDDEGAPPLFAPAVERARRTAVAAVAAAHVALEVVLASTALTVGRRFGWSPRGAAGLLLLLKASEYPAKRAAARRVEAGGDEAPLVLACGAGAAVALALLGLAAADLQGPAAPEATARSAAGYASLALLASAASCAVHVAARDVATKLDPRRTRSEVPRLLFAAALAGDAVAAASAAATSALVLWLPPLAALGAVAAAAARRRRGGRGYPRTP